MSILNVYDPINKVYLPINFTDGDVPYNAVMQETFTEESISINDSAYPGIMAQIEELRYLISQLGTGGVVVVSGDIDGGFFGETASSKVADGGFFGETASSRIFDGGVF